MIKNIKQTDVKREWHLIDAQNKILGRLASDIVQKLTGKNKVYYTPYLDTGDYVVVVNAQRVLLSGKKENQKKYYRHSGYPGGLFAKTASQLRTQKPEEILRHAVVGMLPKTKLAKIMAKKLYVYSQTEHPFGDKFANSKEPQIKNR